ncbi:peroxiredoxin-like family protein [Planctobacterium marinum]|uniref:peroxiredoxin-like family protein n=1 Tax=Planctobacterium marinum TaxID=1631968 RepID=UPI001E37283B|nr:peroxiredoxin-like family protein [Planctobacterium marinum]MCC2604038.1 AhpC/TSA family protein [Planctobacterium marinum]
MADLTDTLRQFKSTFDASTPAEILETINRSLSLFQSHSVCATCLPVGSIMPKFQLKTLYDIPLSSDHLVNDRPLIITFIRGGWCPYCMLEMQAWQNYCDNANDTINLVAITPELPEYTLQAKQDNNITFPILYDEGLAFAQDLGLIWELDAEMIELLKRWEIDLEQRNKEQNFRLPVPATFVIDQNYKIHFRFIEEDYTLRAEPTKVLEIYQKLLNNPTD